MSASRRLLPTQVLTLIVASCGGGPTAARPAIERVVISPTSVVLDGPGAQADLVATALDPEGQPVADARFVWSTGDGSVAAVDAAGRVTATGRGTTTVKAAAETASAEAFVSVDPDTLPPRLLSASLDPGRVDVLNQRGAVRVAFEIEDDRGGVASAVAQFEGPRGSAVTQIVVLALVAGTITCGRFEGTLDLPPNAPGGTWRLQSAWIEDRAANVARLDRNQLVAVGGPLTFEVVSGG